MMNKKKKKYFNNLKWNKILKITYNTIIIQFPIIKMVNRFLKTLIKIYRMIQIFLKKITIKIRIIITLTLIIRMILKDGNNNND